MPHEQPPAAHAQAKEEAHDTLIEGPQVRLRRPATAAEEQPLKEPVAAVQPRTLLLPARRRPRFIPVAALLLVLVGVVAWQRGWPSNWRKPGVVSGTQVSPHAEQGKEEKGGAAARIARAQQSQPPPIEGQKQITLELATGVGMEFVFVPGGSFMMGTERAALAGLAREAGADRSEYLDETPAHRVAVPPFYIAQSPVTVAQFRAFVAATGFKTAAEHRGDARTFRDGAWRLTPGACWKDPGFRQGDDHPVVLVSFADCEAFAAWAALATGKPLRLPTEAEWEYAARGPNGLLYPWGDVWDGRLANHADAALAPFGVPSLKYSPEDDGFAFTSPVGKFRNQSWRGAVDMAGNILQWCSDVYESYPPSPNAPQIFVDAADVPSDAPRALRGGSYLSCPLDCRTAMRRSSAPQVSSCDSGMRLAWTPEAK